MTITEFFRSKLGREVTFGDMLTLIDMPKYGEDAKARVLRGRVREWELSGSLEVTETRRKLEDRMWRVVKPPQVVTAYADTGQGDG